MPRLPRERLRLPDLNYGNFDNNAVEFSDDRGGQRQRLRCVCIWRAHWSLGSFRSICPELLQIAYLKCLRTHVRSRREKFRRPEPRARTILKRFYGDSIEGYSTGSGKTRGL